MINANILYRTLEINLQGVTRFSGFGNDMRDTHGNSKEMFCCLTVEKLNLMKN